MDLIEHLAEGLVVGSENISVWLKERYDIDMSITMADYWFEDICKAVFERKEYGDSFNPPQNPHEVDMDKRRWMAKSEERKEERRRRKEERERQLALAACA